MPGFLDTVPEAWSKATPQNLNPFLSLHVKMSRIAKALNAWSKTLLPAYKLTLSVCREVVLQLDKAQENRALSPGEGMLIKTIKQRILGLAAIEKCRARQCSRITWLRKRDANTRFFQVMANVRRQKTLSMPYRLIMQ
jgi:hypothetical protein